MNLIELNRALRQLRLGGIAAVLEMRLHQAQVESMAPIDLISCLVSDELTRRGDRLLERRRKQAQFRDPQKTLDNFRKARFNSMRFIPFAPWFCYGSDHGSAPVRGSRDRPGAN